MKKYNAVIIGAGSIGALKSDRYDSPGNTDCLTIAHAFWKHPQIELVGIIDQNRRKAIQASGKWGSYYSSKISEIEHNTQKSIDIIAIASPTQTHRKVLEEVIHKLKPKIILMEKPFCECSLDCMKSAEITSVPIVVDYVRRFVPHFQKLRKYLQNETLQYAKVTYTRGLLREASHAIDLMNWFFGECIDCISPRKNTTVCDYSEEDPTTTLMCRYEHCPLVFFFPCDGRDFSVFEIEIMTKTCKILITDHGKEILYFHATKEKTYGNYLSLPANPSLIVYTDLVKGLEYMSQNLVDVLEGKAAPLCSYEEALAVHNVIEEVR